MILLNLDKEFQPFLYSYGKGIEFDSFVFPSKCEVHIKLPKNITQNDPAYITTRLKSSDDIMTLLMATDALKRQQVKDICVLIPYLPYARQDRNMEVGDPLALKVFSDLLNTQSYSGVFIYDPHSYTALATINNSIAISNHKFVAEVLKDDTDYLVVSPDAGAYKKIYDVCKYVKYQDEIIICNKFRDVTNGVIRSVSLSHDDLQNKTCYIIDDICDGGGTFVLLAEELKKRNAGKVKLIVSHGIFSKGIEILLQHISHVYCTNSFGDLNVKSEYSKHFTQIKLTYGLLLT